MIARQHSRLGYFQVMADPVSTCVQRSLEVIAFAHASLRHEIIDTAFPVLIARIPILHGRIFHFGTIMHYNFHDKLRAIDSHHA